MWMLSIALNLEEVDDIDKTDLQFGEFSSQQRRCRQRFLRWDIAGTRKDDVGFLPLIIACLAPDADAFRAMRNCGIHIQILQVRLFVTYDHVDVILASQAVIGDAKQAVDVGWQIDSGNFRSLIYDDIEKAGILVSKTIVVLPPHG